MVVEESVDSNLQPFLFQRARRLLPVTVKSDSGLAEGEIWFMEGCEITFWCVEKLVAASRYEMRADVKTLGRNVDLMVEVVDIMAGRDAAMPGGYLHRGEFMTLEPEDEQRLLNRFWQLNPEHAPPDFERDEGRKVEPERPVQQPVRSPARRSSGPDSVRPQRSSSASRPRSTRAHKPTPGERRRMRQQGRTAEDSIPEPPLQRDMRAKPDVAPGAPLSVMVRYEHREVMQADATLRGDDLWIFIGCHPLLMVGEECTLFIQLPVGNVIQLRAEVAAERRDHCVIRARRLHAALLANVKAALGV